MTGLAIWGMTDPGRCRGCNEDAVAWDIAYRWAVLADGMGGHCAGDVASRLVVETARHVLAGAEPGDPRRLLRRAVTEANRRVYAESRSGPDREGMGSTVVLARFTPRRLVVAHVGDSRVYRLRAGELSRLTVDHSLVQELVDSGFLSADQAGCSPHRNVITRAVGIAPGVEADIVSHESRRGDRVLLCSDGLSDLLDGDRIAETLSSAVGPEAASRALVARANECGGTDNIAVVVADLT